MNTTDKAIVLIEQLERDNAALHAQITKLQTERDVLRETMQAIAGEICIHEIVRETLDKLYPVKAAPAGVIYPMRQE